MGTRPSLAVDFRRADSNGDEQVDIADGAFTTNFLFLGRDSPGSQDSADANDDGFVDAADAIFTYNYLFLGGPAPPAPFPNVGPDPTNDSLTSEIYPSNVVGENSRLSFDAANQVFAASGSTVRVPVNVVLNAEGNVEAWSLSIVASGNATIDDVTTQGTIGADVNDDPPGRRNAGFERSEIAGSGVVSAVDLSFTMPITLPDGSSNTVLTIQMEGTAPSTGARDFWELNFVNGIQGAGEPVTNVVSIDGLSSIPTLEAYRVEIVGVAVGDTNNDGQVNIDDLNSVRNHFGSGNGTDLSGIPGDAFPFDGLVNIDDLNAVRNNFGAGASPVPEPSALLLALLVAALGCISDARSHAARR